MNPYQSAAETYSPPPPARIVRNAIYFGAAAGSFVWFSLFFGLGAESDFGLRLSRLYGGASVGLNVDWMILEVLIVLVSMISFSLSGLATQRAAKKAWSPDSATPYSRKYLSLIPAGTIFMLIALICVVIGASPVRPVFYSVTVVACCSWLGTSVILESGRNSKTQTP